MECSSLQADRDENVSSAKCAAEFNHHFTVTLCNMAGSKVELPRLSAVCLVRDLALQARAHTGCPLCAMKLIHEGSLLTDLSLSLMDVFGADVEVVELIVVRRQLAEEEQAELDKQLIRCVASGADTDAKECLTEGAQVDPETNPCGGVTALMMSIAAGDHEMSHKLLEAGAAEPNMVTEKTIGEAFGAQANSRQNGAQDWRDVARCIAQGADVNTKLVRGQGIRATSSGSPLHACCALHMCAGSAEIAHLLIRMKANLAAGDAEGDTPLAHAKYFGAHEMFDMLKDSGAQMGGPFYRLSSNMFGRE
jgi:hypothetical protein